MKELADKLLLKVSYTNYVGAHLRLTLLSDTLLQACYYWYHS